MKGRVETELEVASGRTPEASQFWEVFVCPGARSPSLLSHPPALSMCELGRKRGSSAVLNLCPTGPRRRQDLLRGL